VVVAAGNDFFVHGSKPGMGFPAIIRECISVGAVYDGNIGSFKYKSGAIAKTTGAGRHTPFSQRLHPSLVSETNQDCCTIVFAPGAPTTSSGITGNKSQSIQHGTSQAAPATAGVILLLQHLYQKHHPDELPEVSKLEAWLLTGGLVNDGDDEDDNVTNTGLDYFRLDAMAALSAANSELRADLIKSNPQVPK
jgi:subtilisin family serine protease